MAVDRGTSRSTRERDLVRATRALFDERGLQDAPVEEIAKAVGIARGLIYRHFSSKEELYVLTVTDYLHELRDALAETATTGDPAERARLLLERYAGFCVAYPAFLDCSLSLMQRPAEELQAVVSDSVWLRLGQGMAACIGQVAEVLREGRDAGVFPAVDDPDVMANLLWTQVLGAMHLARLRVGVRQAAPGIPQLFAVEVGDVVAASVRSALATLGVSPPAA